MKLSLLKNRLRSYLRQSYGYAKLWASISFAYLFVFSIDITYAAVTVWTKGLDILTDTALSAGMVALAISIPGLLLWAGAELFNTTLSYTVLNFSQHISPFLATSNGGPGAIKLLWTSIRDIANILIIGSFVYIAISKILSRAKNFNHTIVNLLAVAILINFSFFFALVTIDISNWASVQIYNAVIPSDTPVGTGLAEVIIHNMGGVEFTGGMWQNILDGLKSTFSSGGKSLLTTLIYILLSMIMTLLAAIMFFRMSFMLIGRVVVLFMLLITSPLAFAAMLIPPIKNYWIYWRDGLIYNSILAPTLLLLLWAVTVIMMTLHTSLSAAIGTGGLVQQSGQVSNQAGLVETAVLFFIGIGLLWAAIRISTSLSTKVAGSMGGLGLAMNKFANNQQGKILGKGLGGAGRYIGLATLGTGFASMQKGLSGRAESYDSQGKKGRAWAARLGASMMAKGEKANFDIRNSKTAQGLASKAGLSMGAGQTGGITDLLNKKDKAKAAQLKASGKVVRDEIAKDLAAAGITESRKDMLKSEERAAAKAQANQEQIDSLTDTMTQMSSHENALGTGGDPAQVLEQTQARVEKLKNGIEAAKNSNNNELAQQMDSEMKQQEAKIKTVRNLIEDRGDGEGATLERFRDEAASDIASIYKDGTLSSEEKSQKVSIAKDALVTKTKNYKDRLSKSRTAAASMSRRASNSASTTHNMMLNQQKEVLDQKAGIKKNLIDEERITSKTRKKFDDVAQRHDGIKPEQELSEQIGLINEISELNQSLASLEHALEKRDLDLQRATTDRNILAIDTLLKSIDTIERNISTTAAAKTKAEGKLKSQKTVLKKELDAKRREVAAKKVELSEAQGARRKILDRELVNLIKSLTKLNEQEAKFREKTEKNKKNLGKTDKELEDEEELKEIAKTLATLKKNKDAKERKDKEAKKKAESSEDESKT